MGLVSKRAAVVIGVIVAAAVVIGVGYYMVHVAGVATSAPSGKYMSVDEAVKYCIQNPGGTVTVAVTPARDAIFVRYLKGWSQTRELTARGYDWLIVVRSPSNSVLHVLAKEDTMKLVLGKLIYDLEKRLKPGEVITHPTISMPGETILQVHCIQGAPQHKLAVAVLLGVPHSCHWAIFGKP